MVKKHLTRFLILVFYVMVFASCAPQPPTPNTPTPQPTATPTPEPMAPEEVLFAYFDSLNIKDFWTAYDYEWHRSIESKETYSYPCLPVGWGATYSSIGIIPYVNYLETADLPSYFHDEGDIEGQCVRLMASYWLDFPEGFGAGPPGEYVFVYTMVFDQNAWKIFDVGASCSWAMETLSNQE